MVDSWEVWEDFQALALRPFGWREVWIGYDPAKGTQNGDSAGCVVIAPPAVPAVSSASLSVTSGAEWTFAPGRGHPQTDSAV
ncbi:terminase, ATPase subunit [Klebsiella pneumoniae subsp. pneumoniae]|uniref:Terminase, ATPase subunit n=1 Tax=Klebsiella pneumoniae subsp. pneumoniae TaxID=72407 RepID=A0A377YUM4_KLEPN|nr:terminase, ATPase subunit [Klebsiella pneumoniae subsp. pneumoniae]